MTGSKSVELIDRDHCGCFQFTWVLKAVKQICGRRIYPGLLNEKKKKGISDSGKSRVVSSRKCILGKYSVNAFPLPSGKGHYWKETAG